MSLPGEWVSFLSSNATTLLGAAALLLVICFLVSRLLNFGKAQNEPPGPRPVPLLGNILQLDLKRPYKTFFELSKKYGSVFTVYLGPKKVVVLVGYETVREAFVDYEEEFGERNIFPIYRDLNQNYGIVFANGDSWKEMRELALTTLRELVTGKGVAEERVLDECRHLMKVIESLEGRAFDTSALTNQAAYNVVASVTYGRRFEYDDPQFINLVKETNEAVSVSGSASVQLYNMFPRLFFWVKDRQLLLRNSLSSGKVMKDIVKNLKETLKPDTCRGFVDAFLVQQQKEVEAHVKDTQYHKRNLLTSIGSLHSAGTDATATSFRWILLLMAKYPHIQEKVYEELSRVVGSRQIQAEDRINLPYTNAVIHEGQRFGIVVPMGIPRQTSRDVAFHGYSIKKGTAVYPLVTSVLHDESQWETPDSFNPSHFLDKEGKFIRPDAFMPFSAGRRACPGEALAKLELFIFFTSVIQRFRFTPPPGVTEDELDLTPAVGLTLKPSPHKLCAVSRR